MKTLSSSLVQTLLPEKTENIFVAYSGGVDSHVLLHLCASEPSYREQLTAVHVHHGLQSEADRWTEHCREVARLLGVRFCVLNVDAKAKRRQSPEEAARIARYAAIRQLLEPDDVVLVAQHREDQLETMLLQLFRGAGVAGLAGMPEKMVLGEGLLLRPLLNVDKSRIDCYAKEQGLVWVEDPSNQTNDYDRNYLRNDIIPLLKQRWPSVDKTVARAAKHCANAAELLDDLGDGLLAKCYDRDDKSLAIDEMLNLSFNRRQLVLRHWFEKHGLKAPGERILETILTQVVDAGLDAAPELRTQARLIKRYRGKLYCLKVESFTPEESRLWPKGVTNLLCNNGDCLEIVPADAGIPVRLWRNTEVTVRRRQGGEQLKLPGRQGKHQLKKLFQEASVPPWLRERIPLIYLGQELVAVAGLWVDEAFFSSGTEPCYQILWRQHE